MFKFLILTSNNGNEGTLGSLHSQIAYLEKFDIAVTLCIDVSEVELIKLLDEQYFDCAYIHIKKRGFAFPDECYDAAKVLEQKNVPMMGSSCITQIFIADKHLTSKKSGMGFPGHVVSRSMFSKGVVNWGSIHDFPVIAKPNTFHASMGISENSIAHTTEQLYKAVEQLFCEYPLLNEVLVERFSSKGQEYTVSILGNGDGIACSVTKLQFKPDIELRLNSAKQKALALEDRDFTFETEKNEIIKNKIEYHAKTLFRHFKLKDYARFDFIVDEKFYFLEANTNPMPGNGFSWEWQVKYGLRLEQIVALFLCSFHFGQVASGKVSRLPVALIESLPSGIIAEIENQDAVDTLPECTGPSNNCRYPELFTMQDRVSSETEVILFLGALTRLIKPRYILETGTHKGSSTIAFAEALRKNGFGRMDTIEIDDAMAEKASLMFSEYPVTVCKQDSLAFVPTDKIDLLYLDSKREVRGLEFEHFYKYLNHKAMIIWHDSSYREANHFVFDAIEDLYARKVIDRLLMPTPRGLTISMLI